MKKSSANRVLPRVLAALSCAAVAFDTLAAETDPSVPPGRDPGGIKVAIVGRGIDYTLPNLANRLARDGEGEIIGYDFIDDDRKPFAKLENEDGVAEIVTGEGQATTLIVVRTDPHDATTGHRSIRYAATTPSKIVIFAEPLSRSNQALLFTAAAEHIPKMLFIGAIADEPGIAKITKLDNMIVVTAQDNDAHVAADIAVPTSDVISEHADDPAFQTADPSSIAAARVAAMAARLQAVEPELSPIEMKERILATAEAAKAGSGPRVLAEPRRHWWLE